MVAPSDPSIAPSAMQDWLHPGERPKQIEQLISGVERYDPAQVQVLEDYLTQQMSEGQYDPLANLATLKLYQFNPDLVPLASENPSNATEAIHDSVTIKILLLSIAHRPFDSDFSLGLSLCGDRMATLALFSHLSHLSLLLHSRSFAEFWTVLRSPKMSLLSPFIEEIADFDNLIRTGVGRSVEECFRRISRKRLETYLGLQPGDSLLQAWLEGKGWTLNADTVEIPANSQNSPVGMTTRESTSLEDLQRLLSKSVMVA